MVSVSPTIQGQRSETPVFEKTGTLQTPSSPRSVKPSGSQGVKQMSSEQIAMIQRKILESKGLNVDVARELPVPSSKSWEHLYRTIPTISYLTMIFAVPMIYNGVVNKFASFMDWSDCWAKNAVQAGATASGYCKEAGSPALFECPADTPIKDQLFGFNNRYVPYNKTLGCAGQGYTSWFFEKASNLSSVGISILTQMAAMPLVLTLNQWAFGKAAEMQKTREKYEDAQKLYKSVKNLSNQEFVENFAESLGVPKESANGLVAQLPLESIKVIKKLPEGTSQMELVQHLRPAYCYYMAAQAKVATSLEQIEIHKKAGDYREAREIEIKELIPALWKLENYRFVLLDPTTIQLGSIITQNAETGQGVYVSHLSSLTGGVPVTFPIPPDVNIETSISNIRECLLKEKEIQNQLFESKVIQEEGIVIPEMTPRGESPKLSPQGRTSPLEAPVKDLSTKRAEKAKRKHKHRSHRHHHKAEAKPTQKSPKVVPLETSRGDFNWG